MNKISFGSKVAHKETKRIGFVKAVFRPDSVSNLVKVQFQDGTEEFFKKSQLEVLES